MGSPSEERTAKSSQPSPIKVDRICIVGAGPSGLAAAKYLVAEQAFSEIRIFEQRATVGGLWNYSSRFDIDPYRHKVPQTSHHAEQDKPIWSNRSSGNNRVHSNIDVPVFVSPVYENLETNIPRQLMGFSDWDWPEDCQLFPRHESVLEYIEQYSKDLLHLIEFQIQVQDVRLAEDGKWLVKAQYLTVDGSPTSTEWTFDAVLVASGHFNVPSVPKVAGIEAWNETYPGSVLHSKFYRHPRDYANQKLVVVGNSASGVDIASQVSTTCTLPILQSQKSESFLQPGPSSSKMEKPEIIEYVSEDRSIRFADGSVEQEIDTVLYCTGYFYSFPFLHSLKPSLEANGEFVENLYQHIFYRHQPTLAFVALNQKIVPFPVAEAQSAVIARVWSGRLRLPGITEMAHWERATLEETGGGRNFHVLKFPKDADYINMLHDWAMTADHQVNEHHELHKRRLSKSRTDHAGNGVQNDKSIGKEPPYWGEKEYWARERFPQIKKAFQSVGAERRSRHTMEDVGFSFDEWKSERIEEARTLL